MPVSQTKKIGIDVFAFPEVELRQGAGDSRRFADQAAVGVEQHAELAVRGLGLVERGREIDGEEMLDVLPGGDEVAVGRESALPQVDDVAAKLLAIVRCDAATGGLHRCSP